MDTQKQKSIINALYICLIISTVLSFMPYLNAVIASAALFIVTLFAAYIYRMKDTPDGLLYNHMTYLIGTIWISSSFLILGIMAAGYCVYMNGDHSVVQTAMNGVQSGVMPSEEEMKGMTMSYVRDNLRLIVSASLVFVGPPLLYLVYRVANGYARAMKGYRIAKPKSWL